ncbi:DR2241 family protein [Halorubrum sp. DTA98]|uniref:DR2241 family protein n=1 Tax=Halorubrum sp. DTA98 TaxID=3402163 RepID=UPI003AACD6B2
MSNGAVTDESVDVDLPSDAFDAFRTAVEAIDDGDVLRFEQLRASRDGESVVVETDEERYVTDGEAALHEVAETHTALVTNWYFFERVVGDYAPRRGFLRWLEGADDATVEERYAALRDGDTREWGQLRVRVRITERGERRYDVRHVDDAAADDEELETYRDPLDARRLVKFDDDGRYRPLKTAPSLPTGWAFPELEPRAVYETVETVYPATVVNWHREREGALDVDHWRETMERQSGIYGVIRTWDRGEGHEHVNRVAAACCDDSQCLKRREWEYDEDTDLDVDGGDGVFPCREPCSLVVSAARKWTQLEGEESRTYEFELTPSEKEQVEAIIDAVADGRTHEIREADIYDGANRYRTRYLRAKLFDEDGNLCGVPTEPDDSIEE